MEIRPKPTLTYWAVPQCENVFMCIFIILEGRTKVSIKKMFPFQLHFASSMLSFGT